MTPILDIGVSQFEKLSEAEIHILLQLNLQKAQQLSMDLEVCTCAQCPQPTSQTVIDEFTEIHNQLVRSHKLLLAYSLRRAHRVGGPSLIDQLIDFAAPF
jgi:predicted aldo/keto reductase-like oxidoreductase